MESDEDLGTEYADVKRRLAEVGKRISYLIYPYAVMGDDYWLELADRLTNAGTLDSEQIVFCHADVLFVIKGIVLGSDLKARLAATPDAILTCLDLTPDVRAQVEQSAAMSCLIDTLRSIRLRRLYLAGDRQRIATDIRDAFAARVELLEAEQDLLVGAIESLDYNINQVEAELLSRRANICTDYAGKGAVHPGFELKTITLRGKIKDAAFEADFEHSVCTSLIRSGLAEKSARPDFDEGDEMHELLLILTAMDVDREKKAKPH